MAFVYRSGNLIPAHELAGKGAAWNESVELTDPWTLRRVRRITCDGAYNNTPTYHTRSAWTADGQHLVFASGRRGRSAILCAHAESGEIRQITDAYDSMVVDEQPGFAFSMCMAPRSRWVLYTLPGTLRAVHLDTLEERTLLEGMHVSGLP